VSRRVIYRKVPALPSTRAEWLAEAGRMSEQADRSMEDLLNGTSSRREYSRSREGALVTRRPVSKRIVH
jgi:hypothetical protein